LGVDKQLGNPFFSMDNANTYKFDQKNFHKIFSKETCRKMAFIDGGNLEIFHAPNFSLQVNRVYFNIFKGKERVFPVTNIPQKIEFLSLTLSEFDEDKEEIFYETSIYPVYDDLHEYLPDEKDLTFSSRERGVTIGNQLYDIERVASIARRFAEWHFSRYVIDLELECNDIFVRDGSLQISFANEDKYREIAFEKAKEKSVIFTGLSKTCHLYTDSGLSLIGSIQKFAEDSDIKFDTWCYYPVIDVFSPEHRAIILIVKLNSNAERIFRFEILREQAKNLGKNRILDVVSCIGRNSKDICFPGYPYGLIDADLQARVRKNEMGIYETRLLSEISKKPGRLKKILPHIKAVDGHEILNDIAGE
jgi:NurA domain